MIYSRSKSNSQSDLITPFRIEYRKTITIASNLNSYIVSVLRYEGIFKSIYMTPNNLVNDNEFRLGYILKDKDSVDIVNTPARFSGLWDYGYPNAFGEGYLWDNLPSSRKDSQTATLEFTKNKVINIDITFDLILTTINYVTEGR